jgi:translation machinery-associated protein 16
MVVLNLAYGRLEPWLVYCLTSSSNFITPLLQATQINRANVRSAKLLKSRSTTTKNRSKVIDRLVWFKYALDDTLTSPTKEDIHDLIEMYIGRNDEEIEKLTGQLRKGRTKPSRLVNLEMLRQTEMDEYAEGLGAFP